MQDLCIGLNCDQLCDVGLVDNATDSAATLTYVAYCACIVNGMKIQVAPGLICSSKLLKKFLQPKRRLPYNLLMQLVGKKIIFKIKFRCGAIITKRLLFVF